MKAHIPHGAGNTAHISRLLGADQNHDDMLA
jgi:hypothetical protein